MSFRNSTKRVVMTLLALLMVFSLTFGSSAAAPAFASETPTLFGGDSADLSPRADYNANPHASRSRFLTVNFDALFDTQGKAYDTSRISEVTLNLFSDATFTGKVKHTKTDRWGSYWWGSLKGEPMGYFYLVVSDGVFIAHVASPKGVYEVKYAGPGVYEAQQLDHSTFNEHPEGFDQGVLIKDVHETGYGDLGTLADSGAVIDVMIAYTKSARLAQGSIAAMKALIALAVLETNVGYANSGVTTRLRLVHIEEYNYAETGDMGTDLTRLMNTSDSHFSTIHALRNIYGADMVGLIVDNGGGYCGLASSIYASSSIAFQVTADECATGYYSFGHEFGHLQGARHDLYADLSTSPFVYGHGYVNNAGQWRTIMAYANFSCGLCTRLQYWSNPNKTYSGNSMGDNYSKNYSVLNLTDYTVANFRSQVIGDDFNNTFNGTFPGWSEVSGAWSIYNNQHYHSAGLQNKHSSVIKDGLYGDVTYEVRVKRTTCEFCENYMMVRGTSSPTTSNKVWNTGYRFEYANHGDFRIVRLDSGGVITELVPWTLSGSIVTYDWNTLKVIAVGSSLKFYINGTLVASVTDNTFRTGRLGVGFYRDTTSTRLYVTYAKANTTATADMPADEIVAPGVPSNRP
jgi:hypothetical protein